jgi:hypothetical protein
MTNIINTPQDYITDDNIWWMIFDASSGNVIIAPNTCSGGTSSPFTMVTADTEEELNSYIVNNGLTLPQQPDGL